MLYIKLFYMNCVCSRYKTYNTQCAVPENIHTSPMEGISFLTPPCLSGNSSLASCVSLNFFRPTEPTTPRKFQSLLCGREVWIFSGTIQSDWPIVGHSPVMLTSRLWAFKTEAKSHIINNLLTMNVQSLWENLKPLFPLSVLTSLLLGKMARSQFGTSLWVNKWCSSFTDEEDHDFKSLGGGVGAEMAEEPNLCAEVSVAMQAGDVGGWTRLGIWTPSLSSLTNLIFFTDAVVFQGQHSRSHKWVPCRTVFSTRFPCGVGNATALERIFQKVFVSLLIKIIKPQYGLISS